MYRYTIQCIYCYCHSGEVIDPTCYPVGASGARILITLVHGMQCLSANKGLATICIGGGQGVAMAVERVA